MNSTLENIKELVLFNVGEIPCGIDICFVQEINKNLEITPVFRAPDYVKGVLNLRGDIVTIIDLRVKFKRPSQELNKDLRVIIVRYKEENVGILVDDVNDVTEVQKGRLEQSRVSIRDVDSAYFAGIYKMDDDLVAILDIEEILKT